MGTIRFALRTETKDKSGYCKIRLVYSVNGKRRYIKSDLKAFPPVVEDGQNIYLNWNTEEQCFLYMDKAKAKKFFPGLDFDELPSKKDVQEQNDNLAAFRKQVSDIEKIFELSGNTSYSADDVIDAYQKKHLPAKDDIIKEGEVYRFIDQYIIEHSALRAEGSLQVFKSLRRHLQEFEKARKRKIDFKDMNYNFFVAFHNYLIGIKAEGKQKALINVTIHKQLSTLKTFLSYAKKQKINIPGDYKEFRMEKEEIEVVALTQKEFELLFNFDFSDNPSCDRARDILCFSCVTGLRYSDMEKLQWGNIFADDIIVSIKKTKKKSKKIPHTFYSKAILNKYKGMVRPLPMIENAPLNRMIKNACKIAGIDEIIEKVRYKGGEPIINYHPKWQRVSCHTGRKSFATIMTRNKQSVPAVMAAGGWTDYGSFKRYVAVNEDEIKNAMVEVFGAPLNYDLKAV